VSPLSSLMPTKTILLPTKTILLPGISDLDHQILGQLLLGDSSWPRNREIPVAMLWDGQRCPNRIRAALFGRMALKASLEDFAAVIRKAFAMRPITCAGSKGAAKAAVLGLGSTR
jgi:hypothetical protein